MKGIKMALCSLVVAASALGAAGARAGEADDLQNMIERSRRGAEDLKRLDESRTATDDIASLTTWLDEAWHLRSQQRYDDVRSMLERCDAQADMIREKTAAAKSTAQASEREAAVKRARAKLEASKKDLQKLQLEKARLEGKASK